MKCLLTLESGGKILVDAIAFNFDELPAVNEAIDFQDFPPAEGISSNPHSVSELSWKWDKNSETFMRSVRVIERDYGRGSFGGR